MKKIPLCLVLLTLLAGSALHAEEERFVDKASRGVEKGAKAAGNGIEKGVQAAGHGIEKGADAVGRGLGKAGSWLGSKLHLQGGDQEKAKGKGKE